MSCPTLPSLAAYCLGELAEPDAATLEEHYFACDPCAARLARMQALVGELHAMLPHVLTPERRQRLEATGQALAVTRLAPGEKGTLTLGRGTELGFWVMRAPVATAARVDFELDELNGTRVLALNDVPFDREQEEVVLACQSSYRELTASGALRVRIRSIDSAGRGAVSEYFLDHVFDSP